MSVLILMKVFGDLCLSIAVLGAFPVFFASEFSLLLPSLLSALGVGAAVFFAERDKEKLRFLGLLFPLITPFLARSLPELLVLAPGALYCAAVILRGKLSLDYYDFRHIFQRTLLGLIIFTMLVWFFSYIDTNTGGSDLNFSPAVPVRYGIAYAVIGIILQRQLRLGAALQGKSASHAQTALLLGGTGVAVGIFLALERMLEQNIQTIFMKAMELFFLPFALLFHGIWAVIDSIEGGEKGTTGPTETETSPSIEVRPIPPETPGSPSIIPEPEEANPWLAVLVLVIVLIMLAVMLFAFRAKKKSKGVPAGLEKLAPESKENKPGRRSNRAKIRRYYRDFLKQEEKRGLKRRPDQTSLDILEELPKQANPKAAADLREVYLHARYHETETISAQQVEQAKNALRKSKEK